MKPGYKPMLAGKADDLSQLVLPTYAAPKYDGIRAMVIDGVVVSRNLKPIPNKHVQKLFGKLANTDGELIVGEPTAHDCFRVTTSGVMSVEGKPDVRFYVFDTFTDPTFKWGVRYANAKPRVAVNKHAIMVPHKLVSCIADIETLEREWLEQGYEGVMLRSPSGPYKYGRSTEREGYLLKLKRFEHGEALVLGCEEQMANNNVATKDALGRTERSSHKANKSGKGTLGALVVEDIVTGAVFNIGTGFSDAERASIWAARDLTIVGKLVRYKYFPSGSKDLPRFPTWDGWRSPADL